MAAKPMKMKVYASFDLWLDDQTPRHREFVASLRTLVKQTAPKLTESVKWGNGCWLGDELPVAYVHAEEDHLQFGFFGGAGLSAPKGLLQGSGKSVRHIKIRGADDIDEATFARLIRQAVKVRYK